MTNSNDPNKVIETALGVKQGLDNLAATTPASNKNIIIDNKSTDIDVKLDKIGSKFEKNISEVVKTLKTVNGSLNAKLNNIGDRFEENIKALGSIISTGIKQVIEKQEKTSTIDNSTVSQISSNTTVNKTQQAIGILKAEPVDDISIPKSIPTADTNTYGSIEKVSQAISMTQTIPTDDTSNLSTNEVSKWGKISEIIGKTIKIGKYIEAPEAQKLDVKEKISNIVSVEAPTEQKENKQEKKEEGTGGFLLRLGAVVGGLIAFAPQIKEIFEEFGPKIKEAISQIKVWWEENKPVIIEALKVVGDLLYQAFEEIKPVLWDAIKVAAGLLWDAVKGLGELIWEGLKSLEPKLLLAIGAVSLALLAVIPAFGAGFLGLIPAIGTALLGILAVGAGAAIGSMIGEAIGDAVAPDNVEIAALSPEEREKAVQDIYKERDARLAKLTPEQRKAMDDADAARRVARNAKKAAAAATPAYQSTVPPVIPNTEDKAPKVLRMGAEFKINKQPNELQDFIVKGNDVYSFNNKDEILGMKDGGAVKQLLSSNSQNNDKQLFIANKQVSILEQIRDGIMIMTNIRNSGNKTTNINTNNAGNQKSLPSSTFLRSDFNAAHNLQPI